MVHSDGEFAPLQSLVASLPGGPMINLASDNEHVPKIERKIRVMNGRCRAARHGLIFQIITKLLTIHILFQTVKLLNFFPTKGGISDTLRPKPSCLVRYSITKTLESPYRTILSGAWVRFSLQQPEPQNKGLHFAWDQWKPAGRLQIYGAQHRKENR